MGDEPSPKRQRLNSVSEDAKELHLDSASSLSHENTTTLAIKTNVRTLTSLTEPISPPARKRAQKRTIDLTNEERSTEDLPPRPDLEKRPFNDSTINIPPPIQLTRVEGLAQLNNVDTVSLKDIVGDPLIKESWVFNYLFDVDFLL